MALSCDLIVAAENAKFGIPEVKRGLVAAAGGLLRLPRRIPYHVAMELALTGEFLDAARGHQFGLVNRLTEPGGALAAALGFAATIAANGPLAVPPPRRSSPKPTGGQRGSSGSGGSLIEPVFRSDDAREDDGAFAESGRRAGPGGNHTPAPRCGRFRHAMHTADGSIDESGVPACRDDAGDQGAGQLTDQASPRTVHARRENRCTPARSPASIPIGSRRSWHEPASG